MGQQVSGRGVCSQVSGSLGEGGLVGEGLRGGGGA